MYYSPRVLWYLTDEQHSSICSSILLMSVVLETGGPIEKEVKTGRACTRGEEASRHLASLLIRMKTGWVGEESHRAGQSGTEQAEGSQDLHTHQGCTLGTLGTLASTYQGSEETLWLSGRCWAGRDPKRVPCLASAPPGTKECWPLGAARWGFTSDQEHQATPEADGSHLPRLLRPCQGRQGSG